MPSDEHKPVPLFTAYPYFFDTEPLAEELRALLSSGYLTNRGPQVQRFEKNLREFMGGNLGVTTVSNATLGLQITLQAMGLKGKVIVSPLTFVATAHSIVGAGLQPVFCDVDPKTLCLSPERVEEALSEDVSAVVPIHAYGSICDVEYFERLRERGVKVIYDAAHAFGITWKGRDVGHFGDASVFSFHATKVLNACEGGAISSRDHTLIERIQQLSNFGFTGETEVEFIGTNAKMSEAHALFGVYSLKQLARAVEARTKVIATYREHLSNLDSITWLEFPSHVKSNSQYLPVLLRTEEERDGLFEILVKNRMIVRKYFYPALHELKAYQHLKTRALPVAESVSRRVLCLPLHAALKPDHVLPVCEVIQKFFSN